MKISFGLGKFGPVDDEIDATWSEFVEHARLCAAIPREPSSKDDWGWAAPFIRRHGATRRTNDDIVRMANWFGLDLDDGNYQLETLQLRLIGSTWLAWTTTNSHPDAMHWRVCVQLDREYDPCDHHRLVRWYQSRFSESSASIAKTANVSRIFYLPAAWEGATNVFGYSYARPVNVDGILSMVPPTPATPALQHDPRDTRDAPVGTDVITSSMLETARCRPAGGRLYSLLCSAASRYRSNAWTLNAHELAEAGAQASAIFAPGVRRTNILREAERAIAWANVNVPQLTPFERMRNNILREKLGRTR